MAKVKDASNGLKTAAKAVAALEKDCDKITKLFFVADVMCKRIAVKLTKQLQSKLAANYSKGGVGELTGELKRAVSASIVKSTKKGFRVSLSAGFPKKVYVRASVFRKYKGFYALSAAEIAAIQNEGTRLFQIEVNNYLKKGSF